MVSSLGGIGVGVLVGAGIGVGEGGALVGASVAITVAGAWDWQAAEKVSSNAARMIEGMFE
jgi:hypothetical protein